jgi:hypothetical protein
MGAGVAADCAMGAAACMAAVNASTANMVMLPLATHRLIGVRGIILLPSTMPTVSAGPVGGLNGITGKPCLRAR